MQEQIENHQAPALRKAAVSKSAFLKTYVLSVSINFPKTHKQAGKNTFFREKINEALIPISETPILGSKIHTLRGNYELWKKRIDEVNERKAVLSLRFWSGKPYNSKQVEFLQLDSSSGIGIQKLEDPTNFVFAPIDGKQINWEEIAKNDGLSFEDFCEWFKVRNNSPMAVIHFTGFRY
jgi:hypothetical protein